MAGQRPHGLDRLCARHRRLHLEPLVHHQRVACIALLERGERLSWPAAVGVRAVRQDGQRGGLVGAMLVAAAKCLAASSPPGSSAR